MINAIAQANQQQKDELLLALFDSSLYGIMVLKSIRNADGHIGDFEFIAVNATTENILGRKVPKGTTFTSIFPLAKESGIFQTYVRVAETKETASFESQYPYHEGNKLDRWYKQKVAAHQTGIVVAFEDVTPHKNTEHQLIETKEHAKETENRYRALFNSMAQAFCIIEVICDETGEACDYRLIEANPTFIRQTGFAQNPIGRTIKKLDPGHEKNWFDIYGDIIRTGMPQHFEQEAKMIDGWYDVYATPIEEGSNRVAVILNDITARKKAEKKAEQERQNVLRTLKSKQMFLSTMSHEIRTPLTAVLGFTDELIKTPLNSKQQEYIQAIKVSGDALLILVNDILDLAKVDEGKLEFDEHPFHLDACVRNMLLLFETKVDQKKLTVVKNYDPAIPPVLLGDSSRLNQIILNLVSNAVKFTHEGEIVFSAKVLQQDDEKVTIELTVSDTGIGIDKDNLGKIFENFQQGGKEISYLYGGTGLGLSIVKQLTEAQGGAISVESEMGVGSTFRVALTYKKPKQSILPQTSVNKQEDAKVLRSGHPFSILVAEDAKLSQLLMKTVLTGMGFQAEVVSNGREAVALLGTQKFDLVLMDIQMPLMDGYEATREIREVLKLDIPIIALTADVTSTDLARIKHAGMDDYATKPISRDNLFNTIMKILDGRAGAKGLT